MRRTLIAAAAALLAGAAGAGPAGAVLEIEPEGARLLTAAPAAADREPVFAAEAGERYRFQVGYEVGGAARIGTGHLFSFENAITGEQLDVAVKSFPPEPPGAYNESITMTIPAGWAPGVYRFRWTITARNPRLPSVEASGAGVFLVVGPSGG
jgi:hypothetical protein